MKNILIVGSGGHANVVIDVVEQEGLYNIAGILDRFRKVGEQAHGYPILGGEEVLPDLAETHAVDGVLVAIGDNFVRSKVVDHIRATSQAVRFVTAVHPKASVARNVSVGEGTVVMAGASINPGSSIGRFCILNTNSSLDHDSKLEDFGSLAPGVTTGGNCRIGRSSAVCIGAILVHGVQVGAQTVIGAGSIVLESIGEAVVAYGAPAKVIRGRKPDDRYL